MVERQTVNLDVPGSRPGGPAYARMVESVYTTDLKFVASSHVGSSPTSGTRKGKSNLLHLTEKGVEVFIKRSQTKLQESFWNNYDLVIWKKDSGGYTDIKGMYRKDAWGKAEKISVSREGIWKLPKRYVKYFK